MSTKWLSDPDVYEWYEYQDWDDWEEDEEQLPVSAAMKGGYRSPTVWESWPLCQELLDRHESR